MDAVFCEVRAKADEPFEYQAYDTMQQCQMAALTRDSRSNNKEKADDKGRKVTRQQYSNQSQDEKVAGFKYCVTS